MSIDEIFDALEDEREQLLETIDGLSEEQLCEPGVTGVWSVKDLLFHLTMWEAELVKLLWQAARGMKPTTAHFNKMDIDQTNSLWLIQGKDRPIDRVMSDLAGVRKQTIRRLGEFINADLNDPRRYPWLGDHPLAEWIAGDSFEHEAEHRAQIHEWRERSGY